MNIHSFILEYSWVEKTVKVYFIFKYDQIEYRKGICEKAIDTR